MGQRVLFFVVAGESDEVPDAAAFRDQSLRTGSLPATPDAQALLLDRRFFEALSAARLTLCAIGREWIPALPERFRGVAVAENRSGWQVAPASAAERVKSWLADSGAATAAQRRLDAAASAILNEPWDLFALWVPVKEAAATAHVTEQLRKLMVSQTADVVVIAVFLPKSGSGSWLLRSPSGETAALPPHLAEDILPTVLFALGAPVPEGLHGTPLNLEQEQKPAGYSPEDEREIQRRLEDLGYL